MIHCVTTKRHRYTMNRHLASFGKSLADQVECIGYRELARGKASADAYIFADIERLSQKQRQRFTKLADRFWSTGACVLNRPNDVRLRYDLLRGLAARGENEFNVYRAAEADDCKRFPVYLRCENDHKGNRSPLLDSPRQLQAAIRQQSKTRVFFRDEHNKRRAIRIGARRSRELLITEFCGTADESGVYRKYAAFCVGGKIVARHLFFGTDWMLKGPQLFAPEYLAEEREYVASNPHEQRLAEIFAFARIDYGRIDYSVRNGRIQVWEINTNPMITSPLDEQTPERIPVQREFAANFERAVRSLSTEIALPGAAPRATEHRSDRKPTHSGTMSV